MTPGVTDSRASEIYGALIHTIQATYSITIHDHAPITTWGCKHELNDGFSLHTSEIPVPVISMASKL